MRFNIFKRKPRGKHFYFREVVTEEGEVRHELVRDDGVPYKPGGEVLHEIRRGGAVTKVISVGNIESNIKTYSRMPPFFG